MRKFKPGDTVVLRGNKECKYKVLDVRESSILNLFSNNIELDEQEILVEIPPYGNCWIYAGSYKLYKNIEIKEEKDYYKWLANR